MGLSARLELTHRLKIEQWLRLHLEVGLSAHQGLTQRFKIEQWSHLHLEVSRKGPPKDGGNKGATGCWLGLGLLARARARAVGCGLWAVG